MGSNPSRATVLTNVRVVFLAARYANWQSGQAQNLVSYGFESLSCHCTHERKGGVPRGTIRKLAKRPSSRLGELWVRIPLVPLYSRTEGWCSSRHDTQTGKAAKLKTW